jgi:CheY-like chemotaxis protein
MVELAGLRVLVVEDEGSVALLIESMLEELGCEVVASVATLAEAVSAARAGTFDFAVLDVNLNGELVFPAAEILKDRGLPFIFSTGYGRPGMADAFSQWQVLKKPFTIEEFEKKVHSIFNNISSACND